MGKPASDKAIATPQYPSTSHHATVTRQALTLRLPPHCPSYRTWSCCLFHQPHSSEKGVLCVIALVTQTTDRSINATFLRLLATTHLVSRGSTLSSHCIQFLAPHTAETSPIISYLSHGYSAAFACRVTVTNSAFSVLSIRTQCQDLELVALKGSLRVKFSSKYGAKRTSLLRANSSGAFVVSSRRR